MNKLKAIIEHSITLFSTIAILICCVVWYLEKKEIEPLIGIIGSCATIITHVLFRLQPEKAVNDTETTVAGDDSGVIPTEKNTGLEVKGGTVTISGGMFVGKTNIENK